MTSQFLAQKICVGGQCIDGPFPTLAGGGTEINSIGALINRVMVFLIPLAVVILFFAIVWGGYEMINSQGAPDKLKSAQAKITSGVVGFVLLIASYLIVRLIAMIFNLDTMF